MVTTNNNIYAWCYALVLYSHHLPDDREIHSRETLSSENLHFSVFYLLFCYDMYTVIHYQWFSTDLALVPRYCHSVIAHISLFINGLQVPHWFLQSATFGTCVSSWESLSYTIKQGTPYDCTWLDIFERFTNCCWLLNLHFTCMKEYY